MMQHLGWRIDSAGTATGYLSTVAELEELFERFYPGDGLSDRDRDRRTDSLSWDSQQAVPTAVPGFALGRPR